MDRRTISKPVIAAHIERVTRTREYGLEERPISFTDVIKEFVFMVLIVGAAVIALIMFSEWAHAGNGNGFNTNQIIQVDDGQVAQAIREQTAEQRRQYEQDRHDRVWGEFMEHLKKRPKYNLWDDDDE